MLPPDPRDDAEYADAICASVAELIRAVELEAPMLQVIASLNQLLSVLCARRAKAETAPAETEVVGFGPHLGR